MTDAVVIGSGPNGLVAANLLADAGWSVMVLEEADAPGGAVRSGELIEPGFTNDLFSSFYPFVIASPHMRAMELERWGVRWIASPVAVAHPATDGTCPAVCLDLARTAESLEECAPGDGDAWRELYALWDRVRHGALGAFFGEFPPVRPVLELLRRLGPREMLRLARFSVLPVRRLGEEAFGSDGGARLLAGNALHADISPEMALGGAFGWVLCSLAQDHGFPVPAGGAGRITDALVARLRSLGGEIRCGERATAVELSGGRARAVRTPAGRYAAARAVIADVGAPQLYRQLLDPAALNPALRREIDHFQYDNATFKVDWTLDGPIPWAAARAREAGTIHVAEGMDALTVHAGQLARRRLPSEPYLVMGQYTSFDATRAPEGKEVAWAYTHVPQDVRADAGEDGLTGRWDETEAERFADRIEAQIEPLAPGFRALIRGRHMFTPVSFEQANRNLVGGALNGGTAQLHQQLVFRPVPGLARPETPVPGLYLGSASAHPGGGVHGGPGANAARAALSADRGRLGLRRLNPLAPLGRAAQR
jgi:phytoene dehydrogenase-like protein